ncbi:MAG TPA: DUF1249 domain-containing protein [Gammaproteobacteria bacterium]|nr:DUF1249 domain-containing protein [Gammaproteobacteria bacterium]
MNTSKQKWLSGYGCEDVDPRGFVSLMDLYENNYMRLRRLVPDLSKLPDSSVSRLPGCLSLHLSILDRTRFTTTLSLTYYFEEKDRRVSEPALTVRVYHDANQLEVLTGHLQHGRQQYDHIPEKAIKIKWKLNRFLYKWLGYCLYLGHHFPVSEIPDRSEKKLPDNLVDIIGRITPKDA